MVQKARAKILRERGVEIKGGLVVELGKPGELTGKTDKMLLIEARMNKDIRELIRKGTVREVGRRLGVHYSTICVWRQILGVE